MHTQEPEERKKIHEVSNHKEYMKKETDALWYKILSYSVAESQTQFENQKSRLRVVPGHIFSDSAVGIWVEQIVPHRLDVGMVLGL